MAASRRLFFALWPDDPTRHALFHWQTENLPADVRWQHRDDLHMTLHFMGQVDAGRVDSLAELGAAQRLEGFDLVLDEIAYWPKPRVLCAFPTLVPPDLIALQRKLSLGLETLGFTLDDRPYRPHVTLARKVAAGGQYTPLPPLLWEAGELVLAESLPGGAPMYRPLRRWRMK